jgi:uncharacterized LabA/DUF88 family protein
VVLPRPAFPVGDILKILWEAAGEGVWVEQPVDLLTAKTGLCRVTVKKYLDQLQAGGYVKFVLGSHYSIRRLSIEKKEAPELFAIPSLKPPPAPAPAPTPLPPPPVSQPAPVPMTTPAECIVAALVDYDNVIGHARDEGFGLSFEKLRGLMRTFGRVLFADAYVPQVNNRSEVVARLSKADFRVIACPQGYKDKDSVDEKMKGDARKYLQSTPVSKVLIVSRDSDFHDLAGFAADLHKQVSFIDIVKERAKIEGYDEAPQLFRSRALERFTKALEHLKSNWNGLSAEEERCVKFLKEIIRAVSEKEKKYPRNTSFRFLQDLLWRENRIRWENTWRPLELQNAMSALVEDDVLRKNTGMGRENRTYHYYTLNLYHKATINTFQPQKS